MRRIVKRCCIGALILFLIAAFAIPFTLWSLMAASLPRTDGQLAIAGLSAPVTITRDARGIPVISGDSYEDVVVAMGYLHAQDRFFQMDVLRRTSSGELSELFGQATLVNDRKNRVLRFRNVATLLLPRLPAQHRAWIEAYTRGVNAGLADLAVVPPEYLLLRTRPVPWRPEDSLLAHFTMYQTLSTGARDEIMLDIMRATLPSQLAAFLTPETTRFDFPLIGPPGNPLGPAPIPTDVTPPASDPKAHIEEPSPRGSNGWAVGAGRTADGRAILANDMHLPLLTPNIWYRAQLQWGGANQDESFLVGVTLPGVHAIVVGSNRHVAWGFTNVTGDFADHVIIEVDPSDENRYLTPDGAEGFGAAVEEIAISGDRPERLTLRTTRWGAVIAKDVQGRPLALRWPALDPEIINLSLFDMPGARTIEDALAITARWYGPPQNAMLADSAGRVAWNVTGWIPDRSGFDNRAPASWVKPGVGWRGMLAESARPTLINPPDGVIFSANQRMIPFEPSQKIGNAWASGARAARIAEVLRASSTHTERSMLALQLDTNAPVIEWYRALALAAISAEDPALAAARRIVESWNGRADIDQPGFLLLTRFRSRLFEHAIQPLLAPCTQREKSFVYSWFQRDEPLMRLLESRPPQLLPKGRDTWEALITAAFTAAAQPPVDAVDWSDPRATWGQSNRARIAHYFSLAVPALGAWLDMPREPLPGHSTTVRVQSGGFGASERLVVSPGHEADGLFHMPGGQSGHPLSPHYADSHPDWVAGTPSPLLAGPPVSTFRLVPAP